MGHDHRLRPFFYNNTDGAAYYEKQYGYDRDNLLTSETIDAPTAVAGKGSQAYTYDPVGRLASWRKTDASTVTYAYDGAGNRTQAGANTYTYDDQNRLTSGVLSATLAEDEQAL